MKNEIDPIQAALTAADGLDNMLARSVLLVELAKVQAKNASLDDALSTIGKISNVAEKRGVLLHLALDAVENDSGEPLLRIVRMMVETDPKSSHAAGRIAVSLLEKKKIDDALQVVRAVEKPFDSDRSRYEFLEKLLKNADLDHLDDARTFLDEFSENDYRDWGKLALARRLAAWGVWEDAERIAGRFDVPRRKSWAYFELARLAGSAKQNAKRDELLDRATEILESIVPDRENAEALSVQLRIFGKFVQHSGDSESAQRILERCESVIESIPVVLQKNRATLFLARVLRESGQIGSVGDYWNIDDPNRPEPDALDRSRILQWIAEAEKRPDDLPYWERAVRAATAEKDARIDDFRRAERIVEIARRFSTRNIADRKPTGDPERDATILSGEEFESYYFSPFAIEDCGC